MFTIMLVTWKRPDGSTPTKIRRAINSVLRQTWSDWRVFLVGDHYTDEEEFAEICSWIPRKKLLSVNLSTSERYRQWKNMEEFWCNIGIGAMNHVIGNVEDGVLSIIEDDDRWLPNHLEILAEHYQRFPQVRFAYTRGYFLDSDTLSPVEVMPVFPNNRPPQPYTTVCVACSWKPKELPLLFRTTVEQGRVFPSDADMWERVAAYCDEHQLGYLYIPTVTVLKDPVGSVMTLSVEDLK